MHAQCDDGWRRCRRRKTDEAVHGVVETRIETENNARATTTTATTTVLESLISAATAGTVVWLVALSTTSAFLLWSSITENGFDAGSALFRVRSSILRQPLLFEQQLQLQQQNISKQTLPKILSGGRKKRNNHQKQTLQQQHALWILNLIVLCLIVGRRCSCDYQAFCSAFQHQQPLSHRYTLIDLQEPFDCTTNNNAAIRRNLIITASSTQSQRMSMPKLLFSPTNQQESQHGQLSSAANQLQRSSTTATTKINNYSRSNNIKYDNNSNSNDADKDDTLDQIPKTNPNQRQQQQRRKQYRRKLPLSPSEKSAALNRQKRRVAYETMRSKSLATTNAPPSIWSFDSLFAAPVLDEKSIREDLFGSKEREAKMIQERALRKKMLLERRKEREFLLLDSDGRSAGKLRDYQGVSSSLGSASGSGVRAGSNTVEVGSVEGVSASVIENDGLTSSNDLDIVDEVENSTVTAPSSISTSKDDEPRPPVDRVLTRMVQDRIYGLTRSPAGSIQYSSSLLDSGRAVQFRDGVRLGKALTINIDRLCYFAKKDFSHGRLEEAQEYYMKARNMDPTDGRPYLGLSRIAQRRGDYEAAKSFLKEGISKSSGGFVVVKGPGNGVRTLEKGPKNGRRGNSKESKNDIDWEGEDETTIGTIPDIGPNPFLLQALGTLEQQMGQLAAAEELYLQAIRSRPSHAAAWVSLAQLRTKELRQGASAGRACYQSAERELQRIGAKPNSYVYTAWASMEYKKGSREDDAKCIQKARELYQKALNVDPQCSAAYLQLGVMESECGNFDDAKICFEKVLKFDQRNSRVLQAYAVMESRRAPKDEVDSRRVLELFERALKANPRDAGVYQAYALYVAELGDIDSARNLFQKATEVNKRHAPAWQAWGVLETRYSTAKVARDVFQQGIWSCSRPGGGQSGGRDCARLWQAWGILEAQEGDHAAARRCFSRALDADKRNAAAVTAWTLMEAGLGNFSDARSIFERVLKMFRSSSVDKMAIWRAYEIMEERAGNTREAQLVFQRSMRESISSSTADEELIFASVNGDVDPKKSDLVAAVNLKSKPPKRSKEVEVSSWSTGSNVLEAEVWMNNGSIEGKVPASMMKKLKSRRM